ncbi:MAG TPA: glycosyltransferase family 87 protein [Ardenticatenaceae bacterium]|jgi:hypothetical protein
MLKSRFPNLPRWLVVAFAISAAFLLVVLPSIGLVVGLRADFMAFYAAGLAILRGEADQLYNAEVLREWQVALVGPYKGTRFVYLPIYAVLYVPFAAQSLLVARALWFAFSVGILSIALRVSRQWSGLSGWESALAFLAFPGSYALFIVGQNSPLTLLLFALIGGLMWRNRVGFMAGVLAGIALYKPQLLVSLLALWVWRKEWRALGGFAVAAGAVGLGSFAIHVPTTLAFLSQGQGLLSKTIVEGLGANASPWAELRHLVPLEAVSPVGGLLSLLGLGALLLAWRGSGPVGPYQHAMLWLAPLLVTPYVASYDLVLLLLPLSFLARRLKGDRLMQAGVALLWIGPFGNLLLAEWILPSVWGAFLVYGLCFWRARTPLANTMPVPSLSNTSTLS